MTLRARRSCWRSSPCVLGLAPAGRGGAPPAIGAPSAIVIDASTGERIYSRAPERAPLDREHHEADDGAHHARAHALRARCSRRPAYPGSAGESTIGLRAGERLTVRDLLRALMLPSANDAAYDLAVNVGGSQRRASSG